MKNRRAGLREAAYPSPYGISGAKLQLFRFSHKLLPDLFS